MREPPESMRVSPRISLIVIFVTIVSVMPFAVAAVGTLQTRHKGYLKTLRRG
jgi:hypothetical protein